jgi:hypothetical protein
VVVGLLLAVAQSSHAERRREFICFMQRKSWKCQAASHVEMTAIRVKETRTGRA